MEIKKECENVVENYVDDIVWYLFEYKDHMREWADGFINAYSELDNKIYEEMQEEDE